MPGADNPYREMHREGMREARNHYEVDTHSEPLGYDPADDPELNKRRTR